MDSHQNCTTTTDQKLDQILSELAQLRREVKINADDIGWLEEKIEELSVIEDNVVDTRNDLDVVESKMWDLESLIGNLESDVDYLRSTHP
jgi:septal ring factor EnvC (AmiA/AmiB activator)